MTREQADELMQRIGERFYQDRVNAICAASGCPPAYPETAAALAEPRRKSMTEPSLAAGSCPRCGSSWTFVNRQWLWTERSGAAYLLKEHRDLNADGTPPPLKRCPGCKAKLEKG